jgi:DnaK suppressor protein
VDQATIDRLRTELEDERAQQIELLSEHGAEPYSDDVADLGVSNDSFADSAQATEERAEMLASLEHARQRVQAIDEATARMDAGTYGICASCGEPIAPERLEARPLSVRCVRCAEAGR